MRAIDDTHDQGLRSFVSGSESGAFPIQNLPFGVFDAGDGARCGVAIGEHIFDLAKAAQRSLLGVAGDVVGFDRVKDLNALMSAGSTTSTALRQRLVELLRAGSEEVSKVRECLVPMACAELLLPATVGDYTDFYTSVHHATNIGSLFRPNNPLLPNYKWIPIGYHGRSSSVVVSGTPVRRPTGQKRPAEGEPPPFGISGRMDYELELGVMIGQGNTLGDHIAIEDAEDHAFGVCLLNDWSARDLQAWEYQPLGPFLGKNFATSISPWVVTMEALAPFRGGFTRDAADPQPLAYLTSEANTAQGALHIELEVELLTPRMRSEGDAPVTLCRSDYRHAYWTLAQMIAHHSVGGCNLRAGDLLGTGTLSGPDAGSEGALIETTRAGKQPLALPNGEVRTFLDDGDEVTLRGRCVREGYASIGLGEVRGTIAPARSAS